MLICSYSYSLDAPFPVLMLGNSLNESLIAEGEDIYMECVVNANPVAEILRWIFDVSWSVKVDIQLPNYSTPGWWTITEQEQCYCHIRDKLGHSGKKMNLKISLPSVWLQNIRRGHSGNYSCKATNNVGTMESNQICLDIKCEWDLRLEYWLNMKYKIEYQTIKSMPNIFFFFRPTFLCGR